MVVPAFVGVVDQDVNPAESPHRQVDECLALGAVGDVGDLSDGLAALGDDSRDGCLDGVGFQVADNEAGAFGGEAPADRATQAFAGSGNDRNPTFESMGAPFRWPFRC